MMSTVAVPAPANVAQLSTGHPELRHLPADEWMLREHRHRQRADALTAAWRARRQTGEAHAIEDFLFTYYPYKPSMLRRWHPGAGVVLVETSPRERHTWRWYASVDGEAIGSAPIDNAPIDNVPTEARPRGEGSERAERGGVAGSSALTDTTHGSTVDARGYLDAKGATVTFIERLLARTAARPAQFGCFGLHEWAMVYKVPAGEVRHENLPLRLTGQQTDEVVEQNHISCSHVDAFRFFTPQAVALNALQPTRESQPELEQAGCLHAGMDVYKWAIKLGPLVEGSLLLDCFELARDIRQLDMRASPYDVSSFGLEPVPIETREGKRHYAEQQRDFADRSNALRHRVLDAIAIARHFAGFAPPTRTAG